MAGMNSRPARDALDISDRRLEVIIALAEDVERNSGSAGMEEPLDQRPVSRGASPQPEVPARKLKAAIKRLSDDEQAILLALVRIGQGVFTLAQIDAAILEAFDQRSQLFAEYLTDIPHLADLLRVGTAACGADFKPVKPGETPER